MKQFTVRVTGFATSFWRDTSGIMLPYVTLILTVIVGFSLLAIDGARFMSLQTQMQAAADALALAGARELNQRTGAQARAISAMANTSFGNTNTLFGLGTTPTFTYTYAFYQSLPDASAGFAGTAPSGTQDQMDIATKFVGVTVNPITVPTIFPVAFLTAGANNSFTAGAQAIAGFTATTVCQVSAAFMCNPYETAGMTNTQATQALITALDPNDTNYSAATLRRQLRMTRTGIGPGNFGWVVTPDCSNSSASCMRTDVANTNGACYTSFQVTLANGNKQVDSAFDTRFDIYSGVPASATNAPSINVRKGYLPGSGHNWCSATPEYNASAAVANAYYTQQMTPTTGTTSLNSTSITSVPNTDVANIAVGEYVAGPGIPLGTTVSNITVNNISTSTVTISVPGGGGATAAGTGVLTFYFPTPTGSGGTAQCFNTTSGSNTLTPSGTTTTGDTTKNKNTLTNVANWPCVVVGEAVSGSHIPNGTTVTAVNGSTVTMSNSMSNGSSSDQTGIQLIFSSPPINVSAGEFITGAGIPANTTVSSVTGSTSITISNNATATTPAGTSANLTFFWLESALLKDKLWTGVCDNTGFCSQGNGDWNCLLYWKINHPSATAPTGCTSSNPTISRYQVYRYEITNNLINDWSGNHAANTTGNTGNGENGAPYCAAASGVSGVDITTGGTDRRNTVVPIINCLAQAGNISNNSNSHVPAAAFAKFFMTQPWSAEGNVSGSPGYLYGEMTGLVTSGDNVTVLNQVQLHR